MHSGAIIRRDARTITRTPPRRRQRAIPHAGQEEDYDRLGCTVKFFVVMAGIHHSDMTVAPLPEEHWEDGELRAGRLDVLLLTGTDNRSYRDLPSSGRPDRDG